MTRKDREVFDSMRVVRTSWARSVVGGLVVTLLVLSLGVVGCSSAESTSSDTPQQGVQSAWPQTVTDDAGRSVVVSSEPKRIASLAPANTEMLFALGLGDRVVGVTTYCDYPEDAASVEKIGDFAGPNIEAITAVAPDLILATAGVQADQVASLEALGATVIVIDPTSVEATLRDITLLGAVTGTEAEAATLVEDIEARIAEVASKLEGVQPVTAFIEIGQDPLFTVGAGTLMDELLTLAGGRNVVTEDNYVPYSLEQVVAANPAVYLMTFGSMSTPETVSMRPGFSDMEAVKTKRIHMLDENLASRPGPRIAEGVLEMAKALHPDRF